MSCRDLPTAVVVTALVLLCGSTQGSADPVIEVVECRVIDALPKDPLGRVVTFTGNYPYNNGNGVAEPGEVDGFWFLLRIPGGLPENPWVKRSSSG